jgi:NitT/TauT family transport system substrate-binding protein
MKTKTLTLLALFLALLIGCESKKAKAPLEKVPLQLKWLHQAQFAGFYIAQKKGFYGAENIGVSFHVRNQDISLDQVVAELVSGKSSFAIVGGDVLLTARAKGNPIVGIAVIFQRNPYVYAVLKSSPIRRPKDLIGKKIMVPPDGSIQHVALMKKLGIDENLVHQVPFVRDVAPLVNGRIDAHMVYRTGSALMFEEKGIELDFIWVDDYGVRLYADTLVTTEKMIQEKPELVERFLKATLKGWRYAIENPKEAVAETLAFDPSLSKESQMQMMQIQMPLIHTGEHPIGWMDPSVWKEMQKILSIPDDQFKIDSAYTMDFLNRIYGK